MTPGEPCPLCLSTISRAIHSGAITLRRCGHCGAVHNATHRLPAYESSYFNEEYREQYGRTYIEDFDNIYRLSRNRLDIIAGLPGRSGVVRGRLLDIGSAYGFFLKAAEDDGYAQVTGIEVSSHAADYCESTFRIPVINSGFEEAPIEPGFQVITAWYFLEHVRDTRAALERVSSLLEPGGVFAFSMPSLFGPQYLFHRRDWYASHPMDHRIDLSPRIAGKALKELGFAGVITRPGGIHPQRMMPKFLARRNAFRSLYAFLSRKLSFSDTMEVYAVKG
jgi:2-polyprenyl-3-methyl-5-hydroxy-6-metoxy-1,4-benzoquinol methylase